MNKISGKRSDKQLGRISGSGAASGKSKVITAPETGEPTPKIFQKVGSRPFIVSKGIYDNMCAFQSMFNSFKGEQRLAFAAGDLDDYTKAFVEQTRDFILPVLKRSASEQPELVKREAELNKVAKQKMQARAMKASGGQKANIKVETAKTGYTKVHIRAYLK